MKEHKELVELMLKKYPEVRDDDMRLFACVCKALCPELMKQPFAQVIWYHSENNLPSYESITRCRRKLQEEHPELRGKKYLQRQERQSEYIEKFGRFYS